MNKIIRTNTNNIIKNLTKFSLALTLLWSLTGIQTIVAKSTLALGCSDGKIRIINQDGTSIHKFNAHYHYAIKVTYPINSIAFDPNNPNILASTSTREEVTKIWNIKTQDCLDRISFVFPIRSITFKPDDSNILALCSGSEITIFDIKTKKHTSLQSHYTPTVSMAFNFANPNIIASCHNNGSIKIWDLSKDSDHALIKTLPMNNPISPTNSLAFKPNNQDILISGNYNGSIKIWDISKDSDHALIKTLNGHAKTIEAIIFKPNNSNIIASCDKDGLIKIWDISKDPDQALIKTINGHTSIINSISFDHNNPNILASASDDKKIKIWDISKPTNESLTKTLNCKNFYPKSIAFVPETIEQKQLKKNMLKKQESGTLSDSTIYMHGK